MSAAAVCRAPGVRWRAMSHGRCSAGRPLRLLVVTALVCLAVSALGQQTSVCDLPCCEVIPSCVGALRVSCRCQQHTQIFLRSGDIPNTVEDVYISGADRVTIGEDAVFSLTSLTAMELSGIDRVEVLPRGLALQRAAPLRALRIDTARIVNISESAFAGIWDHGVEVRLQMIAELHVQQNGFAHRSSYYPPNLIMDHIPMLEIASKGITGSISELALTHVNMTSCNSEGFKGIVAAVHMEHVNVADLKKLCITGSANTPKLSIRSCAFGNVHPQAVSGSFSELSLSATNITTVHENGFALDSITTTIENSRVAELRSHGLNISASKSIDLDKLKVNLLRQEALINIRVDSSAADSAQPVRIHDLEIREAEGGSLKLAKGVDVSLLRLNINSPDPPICPTEKWVRWLVGKDETHELSALDQQMVAQLRRRWLCPDDYTSSEGMVGDYKEGDLREASDEDSSQESVAGAAVLRNADQPPLDADPVGVAHEEKSTADVSPSEEDRSASPASASASSAAAEGAAGQGGQSRPLDGGPVGGGQAGSPGQGPVDGGQTGELTRRLEALVQAVEEQVGGLTHRVEKLERTGGLGRRLEALKRASDLARKLVAGEHARRRQLEDVTHRQAELTRRLEALEEAVETIRAQNESRTIRETVFFTACGLYFVIKAFCWMEGGTAPRP